MSNRDGGEHERTDGDHRVSDRNPDEKATDQSRSGRSTTTKDPLRGSLPGRIWVALSALGILLLLLVIFIAQNTGRVAVRFLGWAGHPPLAVALLVAAVGGLLLGVIGGALRIWQLHRRVRAARS